MCVQHKHPPHERGAYLHHGFRCEDDDEPVLGCLQQPVPCVSHSVQLVSEWVPIPVVRHAQQDTVEYDGHNN